MFTSLRASKPFALLWVSNLLFFGGVWSQTLVMGWLAYELTGSEMLVAVFTAARLAPMLLGPISGATADRYDRVKLLTVFAGWAAVVAAALAVLSGLDILPYWALTLGGLLLGLAQSPSQPARASLVLDLVGRANLSNANALNSLAMNVTQVLGPALGGVMIAALGPEVALWMTAVWYALSMALLLPLRGAAPVAAHVHPPIMKMVVQGFRDISAVPLAVPVLLITVTANLTLWPVYQSFMPVFASEQFGLDADGLGLMLTCSGVGGLIGALIIARLGDFRFKGGVFIVGTAIWASLWAVFATIHSVVPAFIVIGLAGLFSSTFGVLQTTLLLLLMPPQVQGRAMGVQELAIGVMPLATVVLGIIADHVGVGPTTFVAALLVVVFLALLALIRPRLLRYSGHEHYEFESVPIARHE